MYTQKCVKDPFNYRILDLAQGSKSSMTMTWYYTNTHAATYQEQRTDAWDLIYKEPI